MARNPDFEVTSPADPEFKLTRSPFYLMAHADFKYHEDISVVLGRRSVTKIMYRILTVLRERKVANVGELADLSLSKRPTASRAIDRLEQMGLVETIASDEDGRITEVSLTPKGSEILGELSTVVGRQFARALEGISDREIEGLVNTLGKIVANLNKLAIE
ncbi:MAG: MarR family transcriptional regulator [Sphingopyxis sp.]|nr:MarR family transcriptional regulator [Sphingopyxis sp.]